jgi:hypothetical protein
MPKNPSNPAELWQLGFDAWRLWADASSVVMLRSAKIMQGGPGAEREASRMVSEKVEAGAMLGSVMWPLMLGGASPERLAKAAIGHYQKPVGANRRRLMRKTR